MNLIVRGVVIGAAVGGVGAGARALRTGAPGPDARMSALKGAAGGAVVGGGIGWWAQRRGVARLAEAARPVLETAAEAAATAGEVARTRAEELAEAARTRAATVAEATRPVISAAAERAGEAASTAGEAARIRAAEAAARLAPPAPQAVDASGAKTVHVPADPDRPPPVIVNL